MKKDDSGAGCLVAMIWVVIFSPLIMMLYGWTLTVMWSWFVVPVFRLPALGVAYAIGLASTVRLITYQMSADSPSQEDKAAWEVSIEATIKSVLLCGITLGFGYIVKQFT